MYLNIIEDYLLVAVYISIGIHITSSSTPQPPARSTIPNYGTTRKPTTLQQVITPSGITTSPHIDGSTIRFHNTNQTPDGNLTPSENKSGRIYFLNIHT